METELRHWTQWKEQCDIAKCDDDTKSSLCGYIRARLKQLARRACRNLGQGTALNEFELGAETCWALFEAFYEDRASRTGKCYKDWIFASAGNHGNSATDAVERATNHLLYDVVRQFVRTHWPKASNLASLDAALYQSESETFTLYSVLPDGHNTPTEDVEEGDHRQLAAPFADGLFRNMIRRERVAVAVRGLNLPLSCPEAETAAACKKSMLHDARNRLYDRLKRQLARDFPQDTAENGGRLCFYVCEALVERCISWAEDDEGCRPIFRLVEAKGGRG
jgi:hypothetical protein